MQSNYTGCLVFIKVAADGIFYFFSNGIQRITFGEDGMAQGPCYIATLWSFFNQENNLLIH